MINAHIHVFSVEDIPDKFLPLGLVRWLAKKDRKAFNWLLHNLNPFSSKDELDRYLDFVRIGKLGSQKKIFENIMKEYPKDTQFIALTMDMAYMGAGKVPRDFEEQLYDLYKVCLEYPNKIIPFVHVDVRRPDYFTIFERAVFEYGYRGVKLYPPLGLFPYDERYDKVYDYCEKMNMPVLAHCTASNPVHWKGSRKELIQLLLKGVDGVDLSLSNKELCDLFTHPKNYERILQKYPKLNICLAHFGRGREWDYIILDMMDKYDNLYVDCSYSMADRSLWSKFKLQLITNPKLRSNCLFGSDYYMNAIEGKEQSWSCDFRVFLGEDIWNDIAEKNVKKYLTNAI